MGRARLYPNKTKLSQSSTASPSDPIAPFLRSIYDAFEEFRKNPDGSSQILITLLEDCIKKFSDDYKYRNDARFLKIWILYGDVIQEFERVFKMMEVKGICQKKSLLYNAYAIFLVAKGNLVEANEILKLGISRKAEPLDRLEKMHTLLLKQMTTIVENVAPQPNAEITQTERLVDPWSKSTINELLGKVDSQLRKSNGYYKSNKDYSGKVSLNSLQKSSRNKIVELLGGSKYQIRGCSGIGRFAQVYKACIDSNPDDVVVLKIQKPAFPWEFYIYRQLDKRIPNKERLNFGFAHKMHIYADVSILVCDYLLHGTLQDAINSHILLHKFMDEVLCMYYTIEMLRMLETLHSVGIIHGDFKPDNLLVRYTREDLTEDGPWRDQGLCLVDWGRGIDVELFPNGTKFKADCRTSGFRCIEMQKNQKWMYQVDTYGLCVTAHMMLHGKYMSLDKKAALDGNCYYQPEAPFKRYWNVDLWTNLFSTLLNSRSMDSDVIMLQTLRKSFEEHLYGNKQLMYKLKQLLIKQKVSLCSS